MTNRKAYKPPPDVEDQIKNITAQYCTQGEDWRDVQLKDPRIKYKVRVSVGIPIIVCVVYRLIAVLRMAIIVLKQPSKHGLSDLKSPSSDVLPEICAGIADCLNGI